jgi:hypothetical protein
MPVREFVKSDIPEVLSLYWNHMRPRKGGVPPELLNSFQELFFSNPLVDSAGPSFVYRDSSGEIVGFIGIITRKMSVSGQPIRVGFAGNFVVHRKARGGLAAGRLISAYMGGSHDLLLTDSANNMSRRVSERSGFQLIYAMNVHYVRPLRPSGCAAYMVSRAMSPTVADAARLAAKPFGMVADSFLGFRPKANSRLHGTDLNAETLLQCLHEFRKGYSLWPEYDLETLVWLLSFMARRTKLGKFRKVAVRDDSGKIVGWYIYYVKPGAVAEIVQAGGAPGSYRSILGHLFYDAWEQGAVALHGVADFKRIADYSDENCFFTCRGGWTLAYSKRPELVEILQRGNGFLSRMDGEWCLYPGG